MRASGQVAGRPLLNNGPPLRLRVCAEAPSTIGWRIDHEPVASARRRLRRLVPGARLERLRLPARGLGGDARRAAAACCTPPPAAARPTRCGSARCARGCAGCRGAGAQPRRRCSVLWLTPMRALAADTARALQQPLADAGAAVDASACAPATRRAAERARQDRRLPTALVTTPESLTLLLTRERAREELRRAAHGDRRRMARADRQQARRAGAAGAGAAAALEPAAAWSGACRPRSAIWTRRCTRCVGPRHGRRALVQGRHRQAAASIDTLLPHEPGALFLGRAPRRADAAAGGRRDRALVARRWSSPTCARRPRPGTSCC